MKAKLLRRLSSSHPRVILSPKTKLFDLTSAFSSTVTRPHLSHRTLQSSSRPSSHVPRLEIEQCSMRTRTASFAGDRKHSMSSEGRRVRRCSESRTRACLDLNDLIIAKAEDLHFKERLSTMRLSENWKSVLGEINKSVQGTCAVKGVTISLEDKVKAWKEYTEENKKVVVMTKPRQRADDQTRLVRRKFLMASLRKKGD